MLINLYAIPVYAIPLSTHQLVQDDFADIIKEDKHFEKNPNWYCNVDTTFGIPEANKLPFHNFIKGAVQGLNEYLEHLGVNQSVGYGVECWLNRYNKNQHQELHNHAGDSVVSCAYIVKLPMVILCFIEIHTTFLNSVIQFVHMPLKYNNRGSPSKEGYIYIPRVRTLCNCKRN